MAAVTLMGVRAPRLRAVPAYTRTYGPDVVDLAKLAGLEMDPWQADVLDDFCAVSPSRPNQWNALECVEVVGRQNGKGGNLEAYVLGCLFLFDDPLIMYSAHRFATAREMFLRIKELIAGCGDLSRRVKRVSEAHGKEGIELHNGHRLLFYARSDKGGRGFSGDKNILDEAFLLDAATMSAIMPTMSARKNPQIVYASSAGWEISEQLGKLRRRAVAVLYWQARAEGLAPKDAAARLGIDMDGARRYEKKAAGPDPTLTFLEWSAPETTERVKGALADRSLWAMANPALGIRITPEFVEAELRTMGAVEFGRERLGIGDYPPDEEDEGGWAVVSEEDWARLALAPEDAPRPGSSGLQRPAFSADIRPDRSGASIAAAWRDEAGRLVGEVVHCKTGTGWVAPTLIALKEKYDPVAIAIDKGGPAGSVIPELEAEGVDVLVLGSGEVAAAYGMVVEAITDRGDFAHLNQEPLNDAVKIADKRPLGDRHTWDKKSADGDISPVVAVTNAAYAHAVTAHEETDPLNNIW